MSVMDTVSILHAERCSHYGTSSLVPRPSRVFQCCTLKNREVLLCRFVLLTASSGVNDLRFGVCPILDNTQVKHD